MKEITITIYERSDGDYGYDVYEGNLVNTGNEHEEAEELDGGVCTSGMQEALDMACEMAKDILDHKNALVCTTRGCYTMQDEDGEFCKKHLPK